MTDVKILDAGARITTAAQAVIRDLVEQEPLSAFDKVLVGDSVMGMLFGHHMLSLPPKARPEMVLRMSTNLMVDWKNVHRCIGCDGRCDCTAGNEHGTQECVGCGRHTEGE